MLSILVLSYILCVCNADLFDYKLYKDVLDPNMCIRQLKSMRPQLNDASFRAPEGLLAGNLASLGNYHQCLAISQDFPGANIQGKYCLIRAPLTPPTVRIPSLAGASVSENLTWTEITVPPHLMKTFSAKYLTLAICVPKTCTVDAVLTPYTKNRVVNFNFSEEYCRLPSDRPYVVADYLAILFVSMIALLTVASTAYDLRHTVILGKDPKQATELYRACSLYTNTRRLLTFKTSRPIDCLDGIRSLSTLWIVLYHTYCTYYFYTSYVVNSLEAFEWKYKRQALWISSADIAVDSFFTMSGLLLVYTSFNKMTQRSLLRNLHWFYLSRYLRLFPLLACAVLLQASLLHHAADGPGWHHMAWQVGACRRYWWSALLHVQNIANVNEICVVPAWYLSVDMQLHAVSPLVLYWVLGGARSSLAAALLASLASSLASCIIYPSPISTMARGASVQRVANFTPHYYKNTIARSPPFFIGMLFGYILYECRGQKIQLPQRIKIACHGLALGAFVYVIYIVYPSLQEDWDNKVTDTMNNTFRRSCWSLALCWLIFTCVHGYAGPVNWFLSLRLWKFVARISYAMYLFHFLVQLTKASATVTPFYFSIKILFASFVSDLVYTVVWATVACVLVEEPALTLQRIFLQDAFNSQKYQNEYKPQPVPGEKRNEQNVLDAEKLNALL